MRIVRISVCLPCSVELEVEERDGQNQITRILDLNCEASVRTLNEQMSEDDFEALDAAYIKAKDVEPRSTP